MQNAHLCAAVAVAPGEPLLITGRRSLSVQRQAAGRPFCAPLQLLTLSCVRRRVDCQLLPAPPVGGPANHALHPTRVIPLLMKAARWKERREVGGGMEHQQSPGGRAGAVALRCEVRLVPV